MESTVEQQFDGCIEEDEKQLWGFYLLIGEKETNTIPKEEYRSLTRVGIELEYDVFYLEEP
jgi:hypothetical protein